ncbi:hypothetical protein ACFE04_012805 [Oxalis oulophora]
MEGSETICLKKQLDASLRKIDRLEKENCDLRQEVARLNSQVSSLKAYDNERKSILCKRLQHSVDNSTTDASIQQIKSTFVKTSEKNSEVKLIEKRSSFNEMPAKIEKPPPKPPFSVHSSINDVKSSSAPAPPPLPSKFLLSTRSVRRVPEVVELYRLLTKKEANTEHRINSFTVPLVTFNKNMIGEIENRSTYLSAIKLDVEKQKEFINFLIEKVETATFRDISDVEAFVKWLDEELSSLVDERAVLKHFPQWPERKADALREAVFTYHDLQSLESEVASFHDIPKETVKESLKKMQALQDRFEQGIHNIERTRESTMKRYREHHIPWEWMLDSAMVGQVKLSSLRLVKECMKRISKQVQSNESFKDDNLLVHGVRFAYRIHQFVGGFNVETKDVFEELKKKCGMTRSDEVYRCELVENRVI